MSQKDPYELLGVARSATQDEIKRAYRKLAKTHHPDRNPGDASAEEQFKQVQAAYEVVGDPARREQYDRFGAGGPAPEYRDWSGQGARQGAPFSVDGMDDLSGIFEQFFQRAGARSGRTRRTRQRRGGNIDHTIELGFDEALQGAMREVRLHSSNGKLRPERIRVRIPAGVSDGQRIRVRGKGQDGAGGRGDLMIRCRVHAHAYFRRDELDIHLDLPLTFSEAALGTKVDVPTLDGAMRVTIPPGTSSGAKLRLRGKGIAPKGKTAGDQYVIVRVVVPKTITPSMKKLIEQWADESSDDPRADLDWQL